MIVLYAPVGHKRFHVKRKSEYRTLCGLSLQVPSMHTKEATQIAEVTCPRCRTWLSNPDAAEYRRSIEE